MKIAKPTQLELVREFFRQRSLLFIGQGFGLSDSKLVEGEIWNSQELNNGRPRKVASLSVRWRSIGNYQMILRWDGPEEAGILSNLADGLAEIIGKNISVEHRSFSVIYSSINPVNGRDCELEESRKAGLISGIIVLSALAMLLGLLLFGVYAIPIIRSRGIAFAEFVLIGRAAVYLIFRT